MSSPILDRKPIIGFTCGDTNGIGTELIIKSLSDNRILDICTPIIFGSNRLINFYRKSIPESSFAFTNLKDFTRINSKQVNIYNCWEEETAVEPGEITETGGKYAVKSLLAASNALRDGVIDAMITAPIHKKNVYSDEFPFTGHTPFLKAFYEAKDVLMLMVAGSFRVAVVTEHVPLKDVANYINRETILSKISLLHASLRRDFNIERPKIAVLALNPHAGDDGLVGLEEIEIIHPAIKEAKQHNMLVTGPFPADAFFARGYQNRFDAVLAMYHDQGLIPFKSLAMEDGINFTAGLDVVRTSPDHGTAMDISGKNKADNASFSAAIFDAIKILENRKMFTENRQNPLKKSKTYMGGDEKILE